MTTNSILNYRVERSASRRLVVARTGRQAAARHRVENGDLGRRAAPGSTARAAVQTQSPRSGRSPRQAVRDWRHARTRRPYDASRDLRAGNDNLVGGPTTRRRAKDDWIRRLRVCSWSFALRPEFEPELTSMTAGVTPKLLDSKRHLYSTHVTQSRFWTWQRLCHWLAGSRHQPKPRGRSADGLRRGSVWSRLVKRMHPACGVGLATVSSRRF